MRSLTGSYGVMEEIDDDSFYWIPEKQGEKEHERATMRLDNLPGVHVRKVSLDGVVVN